MTKDKTFNETLVYAINQLQNRMEYIEDKLDYYITREVINDRRKKGK